VKHQLLREALYDHRPVKKGFQGSKLHSNEIIDIGLEKITNYGIKMMPFISSSVKIGAKSLGFKFLK
jgi:hypothetical protein